MPARSVRVRLHNQTSTPLILQQAPLEGGEWTDGCRPAARIDPGAVAMFRSESDGVFTGTEGRAYYAIDADPGRVLYVHWDKPYAGPSGYHVNADDQHYAAWTGGRGHNTSIDVVLRPAREVATGFVPEHDGFQFPNSWVNAPYAPPMFRSTPEENLRFCNANNGLCGGMVFAALDYFYASKAIPKAPEPPPGEGDPLFDSLVDRLFDTFSDFSTVSLMLKLINPAYPDTDENALGVLGLAAGRAAVMAHEEWPLIRADIDRGRPSPITVLTVKSLNPGDLGQCHQVLVYAYEARNHQVTLRVYDPNQPRNNDITMSFDEHDVSKRIVVEHNLAINGLPVYCFVRMNYTTRPPRLATGPRFRPPTGSEPGPTSSIWIEPVLEQILEWKEAQGGRRALDVIPDCGQQDFDYSVTLQRVRNQLTATAEHIGDAQVMWSIDSRVVPEATSTWTLEAVDPVEMLVPPTPSMEAVEQPDGSFDWREVPEPPTRGAVVTVTAQGGQLSIESRMEDGSYRLAVRAALRRPGATSDSAWQDTVLQINGRQERVKGLAEAITRCLGGYVKRLMTEAPDEEAIIAAFYAQLGRPLDPVWCPDPNYLQPHDWLALADPAEDPHADLLEALVPVEADNAAQALVDPGMDTTGQVTTRGGFEELTQTQLDAATGRPDQT